MANCRQACPYNTLYGCKVKEYYAICPITNMTKPITEYKMTNADRIRAMSDEELKEFICSNSQCKFCKFEGCGRCELLEWLQQPVKENDYD